MRSTTDVRLQPRTPPYSDGVASALSRLMGGVEQEPLALFRTIAHHEVLLDRFRQLGSTLLSFGRLQARDRELVIHRTTARCGAAYEWGVHATVFGPQVGADAAWLKATWSGDADDPAFTGRDGLLARMVDELHDGGALSADTYAQLAGAYTPDELIELVCLTGMYHLVSFLCGAFAITPEPWAANPPT